MRKRKIREIPIIWIKIKILVISVTCNTAKQVGIADDSCLWRTSRSWSVWKGKDIIAVNLDFLVRDISHLASLFNRLPEIKKL